jgi:sialic acid synthase SpsE
MKIGKHEIGPDHPPYIIAEACNNFNNDFHMAEDMVCIAQDVGCQAIKFQLRLQPDRLSPDQHASLQLLCKKTGIEYLCTAYSKEGVDILDSMGVSAFKIGSAEVVNRNFVDYVFSKGKPVLISTGAIKEKELSSILNDFYDYDSDEREFILMQCTSIYPTPYNKVNLNIIDTWNFNGLSDHTPTIYTSIAAVALGACVIEKHFTLDKSLPGPDQSSSLDVRGLAELVKGCNAVWEAMGDGVKKVYPEELEKMKGFR